MQVPQLSDIGRFPAEAQLRFEEQLKRRHFEKNELITRVGQVARSVFFVQSGACYQLLIRDLEEQVVDLHLPGEWMADHQSLMDQSPAVLSLKAFEKSSLLELRLESIHYLIGQSPAFLQLSRIFMPVSLRTEMFDQDLSPIEKYRLVTRAKPLVAAVFPVKMIASYLKIAPETLSRVRARY
ncbi:Crp/Fnr family transcriptional regulator [Niabella terrae]